MLKNVLVLHIQSLSIARQGQDGSFCLSRQLLPPSKGKNIWATLESWMKRTTLWNGSPPSPSRTGGTLGENSGSKQRIGGDTCIWSEKQEQEKAASWET